LGVREVGERLPPSVARFAGRGRSAPSRTSARALERRRPVRVPALDRRTPSIRDPEADHGKARGTSKESRPGAAFSLDERSAMAMGC
jgi:hypothetical protein